jgi:hypothetical protein
VLKSLDETASFSITEVPEGDENMLIFDQMHASDSESEEDAEDEDNQENEAKSESEQIV